MAGEQISVWRESGVSPEAIGILVRDQRTADQVARELEDRGVQVRQVNRQAATAKTPQLMTMHRAKGVEFECLLIFGVDADLPSVRDANGHSLYRPDLLEPSHLSLANHRSQRADLGPQPQPGSLVHTGRPSRGHKRPISIGLTNLIKPSVPGAES